MAYEDPTGRLQRGVLFAKRCAKCDAAHGDTKDGKKIILTENAVGGKKILLCYSCAALLVVRLRKTAKSGTKRGRATPEEKLQRGIFDAPEPEAPSKPKRTRRAAATAAPLSEKVAYIKTQGQTRDHHCHWPGCKEQVPPAVWGCKPHWMKLPKHIRDAIWGAFVPGQEKTLTPSEAYLKAARRAEQWIANRRPGT